MHNSQNKTIFYLCYGQGNHIEETIFSLLTAFKFLPPGTGNYRYVVYTDHPEKFSNLGIIVHPLNQSELDDWLGGSEYKHRRKTVAIMDALRRFPGDLAFVDCDTYFRRSPARLFEQIGPGRSCLHVLEAHLLESRTKVDRLLSNLLKKTAFLDREGEKFYISPNAAMWNSGVVGINSADISLMEDILFTSDQMWSKLKVHHIEQFVTGYFLARNELSECTDTVFHYWPGYIRKSFQKKLPGLLARDATQPLHIRAERAFESRPRTPIVRSIPVHVRGTLRQLGFHVPGVLMSA